MYNRPTFKIQIDFIHITNGLTFYKAVKCKMFQFAIKHNIEQKRINLLLLLAIFSWSDFPNIDALIVQTCSDILHNTGASQRTRLEL